MSEKMKNFMDKAGNRIAKACQVTVDAVEEAYDVAEAVTVNSCKAVKNAVKTTLDRMTDDKK